MSAQTTEADARILIDDLLKEALWDPADKSQVLTEVYIQSADQDLSAEFKVEESQSGYGEKEIPGKIKKSVSGRADYVLQDSQGRPLAVIEAKKNAINPYVAKQQALPYAQELGAPFIFLTNGELIYFWDYRNDDARIVASFYSRRDMERIVESRKNRKPMATIEIPEYYIRQGETRALRPYQKEAMRALDHAVELGKKRFLIELPTGTGKTDLTTLYIKRLIEAGWAERVLFLVDREQLAKQAIEAIQDLLGSQYGSYWLKPGMARQEKQITVCLLQTMINRCQEYTSGYFDVVVMDESHRSIYGAWQASLTRFDALHIGLTATPANYIDRNTYEFYHCKAGQPDFSYSIQEAFDAGFLSRYKFATGITEVIAEGVDVDEEHYEPAKFEREWTNEKTNRIMMEEFDRLAWESYKELAPGQKTGPGKAVVFAITKHHATRLTQYLNELHPEHKGNYAVVITSDVSDPDALIRQFKKETYPMVAVSVGMLDTGFDCREILHLVMCRRVMSPILYQQMRGRGTRLAPHIQKKKFVIYDFFNNHKRWNDTDTDVFTGGSKGITAPGGSGGKPEPKELIELGVDDEWLEAVSYIEVGPEGERIDKKEYQTHWEKMVREMSEEDPVIEKVKTGTPLSEQEEENLARRLNSPRHYFNEENLRKAYKNPVGSLVDFIKAALGLLKIKSRDEKLEELFRAWLVSKSLAPDQAQYLSLLKNRGIATGKVQLDDLFKPPLSILNAAGIGIELFGEKGLQEIVEDLNNHVFSITA
ncbi:type I restriction endonuclease subunit R [Desulfobacter postgatei]|uniref:Helicase, type I site-specific restriction-modification system restriction subunit n=1 Tax=Desulfobacter postgatei 2ac9 TaxID=879212 RepID=I5AZU7_9BACT|nr:type I restriction endonuclease subunit R [Desulfobacter postgatei]EIM62760.1 helicase, type I site-specific restriction-modification system restriction subunit [Desulfobacter postgatei 2ac9]